MTKKLKREVTDKPKKCQREKGDSKREENQETSDKIKPSKVHKKRQNRDKGKKHKIMPKDSFRRKAKGGRS